MLSVLVWSFADAPGAFWFIYLTHWTLVVEVLYLGAALYTTFALRGQLREGNPPAAPNVPRHVGITATLRAVALPASLLVSVTGARERARAKGNERARARARALESESESERRARARTHARTHAHTQTRTHTRQVFLLYWLLVFPYERGPLQAISCFTHGVNFLVMLLDAWLSCQPYRFSEGIYLFCYSLLYLFWSMIHALFKVQKRPSIRTKQA
jgi:hypothetical protein